MAGILLLVQIIKIDFNLIAINNCVYHIDIQLLNIRF